MLHVDKVVVFGGGSFGTAMGVSLARQRKNIQVGRWGRCEPALVGMECLCSSHNMWHPFHALNSSTEQLCASCNPIASR